MLSAAGEKASLAAVKGVVVEVTQRGAPVALIPWEAIQPAGSNGALTRIKCLDVVWRALGQSGGSRCQNKDCEQRKAMEEQAHDLILARCFTD